MHATVLKATKDVKGFGILATYDFSIHYCYNKKMYPGKVHLQAGAYEGAKYLIDAGYNVKIEKDNNGTFTAELSTLPEPLAKLGTIGAEDFLCIYKSLIKKLSKHNSNK